MKKNKTIEAVRERERERELQFNQINRESKGEKAFIKYRKKTECI